MGTSTGEWRMDVRATAFGETAGVHNANTCRFCGYSLKHTFVDLGVSPLCERFLVPHELDLVEPFFPLHAYVCDQCY
jgi:hypothetical protein